MFSGQQRSKSPNYRIILSSSSSSSLSSSSSWSVLKVLFQIVCSYMIFVCGIFENPELCASVFFFKISPLVRFWMVSKFGEPQQRYKISKPLTRWPACCLKVKWGRKRESFIQAGTKQGSGHTLKLHFMFFMVLPSSDPAAYKKLALSF